MNSEATFSTKQVMRLLKLAENVCTDRSCDAEEAVGILEDALRDKIVVDRRPQRTAALFAAAWRRVRLRRNAAFGVDVFRDPAWDMLLDLYAAEGEQRESYVGTICCEAGVPERTALRHLGRLVDSGLIERHVDPRDRRREIVRLTEKARPPLADILRQIQDCC